jgi:hypothetical protein
MPRKPPVKKYKDYERRIINLMSYRSPQSEMAARLLKAAEHDDDVSVKQYKRLERIFSQQSKSDRSPRTVNK